MKLYVASSWRNHMHPLVVAKLREAGHEVYDFKNPSPGNHGFHWSEIDRLWENWGPRQFAESLLHPLAVEGEHRDFSAMEWADAGVLLLPCGRSAHLEAGYFVGAKKPLYIHIPVCVEPELMYRMAFRTGGAISCSTIDEMVASIPLDAARKEVRSDQY